MNVLRQVISRRSIHLAPRLPLETTYKENGIKGLMSAQQFQTAWCDYQSYLTRNLTLRTVDSEYETRTPMAIALSTAKDPQKADIFHYASQAHNNHFFFQQLKESSPFNENEIKPSLLRSLQSTFQSMDNFKNELLLAADVMSGNGWVYLIEDENKILKIVSCNNDGTPYLYTRNQSVDLNATFEYSDFKKLQRQREDLKNGVKDYSLPLLCINVWEYAYLVDYGVNGKAEYLEKLWDSIDWNVINKRVFSNIEM
ncbi:unnamed protein product [Pichia kudriavzevii]|uniref:Manganese/iron superoxide dismutase C-terminal domain-containing protein n=1 Tax=Pichia kudriavzevii TaxID=4909 RepID=A0A099NXJ3_PICKU|nr:hypothetical protein JL09_g3536 [Pichia kudriavzevii]